MLVSAGEVMAGVEWPGLMRHARYVEPDGSNFLWMIAVEHEGVEHVTDLEVGRAG